MTRGEPGVGVGGDIRHVSALTHGVGGRDSRHVTALTRRHVSALTRRHVTAVTPGLTSRPVSSSCRCLLKPGFIITVNCSYLYPTLGEVTRWLVLFVLVCG